MTPLPTRQYDYVGEGVYLHLDIRVMPVAVEVRAFIKHQPDEAWQPLCVVSFWKYKAFALATGSKDPVQLALVCRALLDDSFIANFPGVEKAFAIWRKGIPTA